MRLEILLNNEHRTWQQICWCGLCVTSQKKTVREYTGGPLGDVREASIDIMPLNTPRPPSPLYLHIHCISSYINRYSVGIFYELVQAKAKAIPLQALTDPEGSRRLRLPDFKTIGT
jgi:hypothetical protein